MNKSEDHSGTNARKGRSTGHGPSGVQAQAPDESAAKLKRLRKIRHKLIVMSGKGGVGKSTVAVELACGLAREGARVGLLDVDIHGPSIPHLMGLEGLSPEIASGEIVPLEKQGIRVMSIGFLLDRPDTPVIWRGPLKMSVIKQFLADVVWGELDYLIIDCPPGTGDEPLSVVQLVPDRTGAVIVTTPQKLALLDVRKSIGFCRQTGVRVLGVVENMSGLVCPKCGEVIDVFGSRGGERLAAEAGVPLLGRIPLDTGVVRAGDAGKTVDSAAVRPETRQAVEGIVKRLRAECDGAPQSQ